MNKKIIPIIGVLLVLGVGGFVYLQQKTSPPVSPEMKKVQNEVMAKCKFDADFCRYAANGIVAMSGGYTMTSESTYNGKVSKSIIKFDGKENMESTSYSDGKEEGKFVTLDKVTYMKGPGETVWTEFPVTKDETGKQSTSLFDFESFKKELGNISENEKEIEETLVIKKVGTETCGSTSCVVFEMTDKNTPDFTTKIWVDTKQYYARKMETKSTTGVSTMTFEYGPVTITKPSPVKKMPSFDSGSLPGGASVDMEEIKNLMKDLPQQPEGGQMEEVETPPQE